LDIGRIAAGDFERSLPKGETQCLSLGLTQVIWDIEEPNPRLLDIALKDEARGD
jgi:hypothetical protein